MSRMIVGQIGSCRSGATLAALLLLASATHAQSVDGTLTDSVSHAPIPNVIVTLLGPQRYNDTTDEAGVFHMGPVAPGKYVLNIVKAGFVLPPERRAGFQVDSDTRLSVVMDPLSLVEGRVRYPDGRPAPRASVWLTPNPDGPERNRIADIGGHFVFDDVKPGHYILRAEAAPGDPKMEGEIWAATFFPSTTDRAAAEPIRVAIGLDATHEIRLRSVPARRVRGIVRDETGRPANGATVALKLTDIHEEHTAQTGEDGAFDFLARDGEWRILATRKDGEIERQGYGNVVVSKHDLENVEIRMALPFSVPLIIDRDDPPGATGRPFPSMVFLSRTDQPGIIRPSAEALQNVYPGRYQIQPLSSGPGLYVESIKLGEVEVYGRPIDLWDGSLPIRITYKRGAPVVRGTVEEGGGATVAIFNADETLVTETVHSTAAGSGGRFEFGGLRPGDYYVVALDPHDPAIATPAFRRTVLPRAGKVHLEKGGSVLLHLKITPWPE
jgi:hypothetical protein